METESKMVRVNLRIIEIMGVAICHSEWSKDDGTKIVDVLRNSG